MKLLLINAIDISSKIETAYPPLGLAYISSYLKKHIHSIRVKITDRNIENVIKEFSPDIVGVSSVSQNFGKAIKIGELCKQLDIPVFIGSIHISMLPDVLPEVFDFGVVGEGEETTLEVMRLFSQNKKLDYSKLKGIQGLVLHTKNSVELTEPRPLIENLDLLPFPDRELLDIPVNGTTYLFTSRGCPYDCTFCASTRFWNKTRWFSAEYVVEEVEYVVKRYQPWAISFYDDLFVANFARLKKFIELIHQKGLHKKVKFSFACRSNLINERLVEALKQIDIHMICMGLESGCQKTLEFLKGPGSTVEQNKHAVELLVKANINTQATFIIGSPDETEDEIIQTLDFIKKSKLINFDVYVLTPFPGTPIWDIARQKGLVSNDMDWEKLTVNVMNRLEDKIVLSKISKTRLLQLHNLFMREKKKRRVLYVLKNGMKNPLWVIKKVSTLLSFKRKL